MPHEEVRDYFYQRQNYLHELDTAAEDLTIRMRMHRAELARELSDRLTRVHGVHIVRRIDLGDTVLHRFDPASKTLEISGHLSSGQTVFKMAAELAYLEFGELIDKLVDEGKFTSEESTTWPGSGWRTTSRPQQCCRTAVSRGRGELPLRRRATLGVLLGQLRDHLPPAVDVAAAVDARRAVLLRPRRPRGQHVKAAVRHRFSLLLQRRHLPAVERLRDVRQPRQDRRADRADARRAQLHVGGPHRGATRASRYGQPGKTFAIGLGCELRHAHRLVYSEGLDLSGDNATPIGAGCRVCERDNCPQRAFPALGRALDLDEHRSTVSPVSGPSSR